MEIWFKVMEKSWKSIGQNVEEPCYETWSPKDSGEEAEFVMCDGEM